MRKVAIYARVSTEHAAQLSALDNQLQYYDELIAKHDDWEIYRRYIDEGITGTSIEKRNHFMEMIEDAKNGYFDLIVTREVSRFARNTVDTLQVTRELKKYGVEVYFTEDNIWTFKDEDGELKLTIMATLAQNESKKVSQRVKAGQKISFLNGVLYGTGNILGYDKIGKDLKINPEQAKVVKYIFDSFLKGEGTTKIKYDLENKGIPTATGLKNWNTATITRILKNPFYCGTIVYRKSYVPDFLEQKAKINKGEVEQIVVEGKHEPIISKEDFNKVQEILKIHRENIKKQYKGASSPSNIWSKKLICSCGSKFNRKIYHRNDNVTTYCYQCYNQKNNGSKGKQLQYGVLHENPCDTHLVAEWKLSILANKLFSLFCNNKEEIILIINKLLESNIDENATIDGEIIDELNSKLRNNENKLSKLLDMYLNDMITKDNYIIKQKELQKKSDDIRNEISKQEAALPKRSNISKLEELKKIISENIIDNNNCVTEQIIEALIDKVVVSNDKFIVRIATKASKEENDVYLTSIMITKDDMLEFERNHSNYKRLRLSKPIIIDIFA